MVPSAKKRKLSNGIVEEVGPNKSDYFCSHFDAVLDEKLASNLLNSAGTSASFNAKFDTFSGRISKVPSELPSEDFDPNLVKFNKRISKILKLTDFQLDLLQPLASYMDVNFNNETVENSEEIMQVYCLHAVNHVLKTRARIVRNSQKLRSSTAETGQLEMRDQGFVRPKVVIIVPFRKHALEIVEKFVKILFGDDRATQNVVNKKRFYKEFGAENEADVRPEAPDDYRRLFQGNTDDAFRVGLALSKKGLKVFADFYSSDILLASPLGLRMAVGADGEAEHEFDFLSAVELLIMDKAELFLMQNWQHVTHLCEQLHKTPVEGHDVDYQRVKVWQLNGWGKLYRQTLLFSSVQLPEMRALFGKFCSNFEGCLSVAPVCETNGTLSKVRVGSLAQRLHRFEPSSLATAAEQRFDFFVKNILPQYNESKVNRVLLFVPSYFDFVRLRNHFKRESVSFVQICEYSKLKKVARARDLFYHGKKNLLLLTERFHFYRRYPIKGADHVLFYQLPVFGQFYPEILNFTSLRGSSNIGEGVLKSGAVLYSKFDADRLAACFGLKRAKQLLASEKTTHVLVTD